MMYDAVTNLKNIDDSLSIEEKNNLIEIECGCVSFLQKRNIL